MKKERIHTQAAVYRHSDSMTNHRSKRHPLIPVGSVIGYWTVLENDLYTTYGKDKQQKRACRVRCVCGIEVVRTYMQLKRKRIQSCGCKMREMFVKSHARIPVDTKVGRWTVLENDLYKSFRNQRHRACRVRCECGTVAIRTYGELRCGRSPSCGCKSRERDIEVVWRDLLQKVKCCGHDSDLTLPQLKAIAQLSCRYCGKEPSNIHRLKYKMTVSINVAQYQRWKFVIRVLIVSTQRRVMSLVMSYRAAGSAIR